ncbi:hypothetical protein [Candidatus Blastococcus massiliensis]|uniref:hypothetical protein n=1 Tax=Candidatus Blastococcus massiliensis TaxID=1470358 RepID=UPI0004BB5282|nr:hypothetical protein [Candidatus Blastococcus massiliensis]
MSTPACPECGREQLEDHPAGLLFQHSQACTLLAAEDARRVADVDQASRVGWPFTRPATAVERQLLTASGRSLPADDAEAFVIVDYALANAVRRRTFPTAEPITPQETP